jgi:hypothetical protein
VGVRPKKMNALAKLMKTWSSEGIRLFAPENKVEVCEVFASVGSHATSDVVNLYATLGGMDQMDKEYWRLWPLKEIIVANIEHSLGGVLFSDYLMHCWSYRLRPNNNDSSAVLVDYFDGNEPTVVANTIEEFLEAYVVHPTRLLDARSLEKNP